MKETQVEPSQQPESISPPFHTEIPDDHKERWCSYSKSIGGYRKRTIWNLFFFQQKIWLNDWPEPAYDFNQNLTSVDFLICAKIISMSHRGLAVMKLIMISHSPSVLHSWPWVRQRFLQHDTRSWFINWSVSWLNNKTNWPVECTQMGRNVARVMECCPSTYKTLDSVVSTTKPDFFFKKHMVYLHWHFT